MLFATDHMQSIVFTHIASRFTSLFHICKKINFSQLWRCTPYLVANSCCHCHPCPQLILKMNDLWLLCYCVCHFICERSITLGFLILGTLQGGSLCSDCVPITACPVLFFFPNIAKYTNLLLVFIHILTFKTKQGFKKLVTLCWTSVFNLSIYSHHLQKLKPCVILHRFCLVQISEINIQL